jgi:hypothetical protein
MIDIQQHLKQLAIDWGLSEKEVMTWWRGAVRRMWAKSPPMLKFVESECQVVTNTNPRSMKRFPEVKRFECAIDNKLYGSGDVEVDHVTGENPCTSFEHAEGFLSGIVFVSKDDLQILSKDNHKIKTYAERQGYSFNEAKIRKEVLLLAKGNKVVDKLKELGVQSIPNAKSKQQKLLLELMLNSDIISIQTEG